MNVRPSVLLFNPSTGATQAEILLLRYNYNGQDVYGLPGGNPDKGETLPATIIRELQEELGLTVAVGTMVLCGEVLLADVKNDVLHTVFQGEITAGTPALNPAGTTALEMVWQPVSDLEDLNLYPNVGKEIHRWFMDDFPEPGYIGTIQQVYF